MVKAFGKERQEIERFSRRNESVYGVSLQTGYFTSTLFPMMGLSDARGGLIVWSFGGWEVLEGSITFGTLMTFIYYLGDALRAPGVHDSHRRLVDVGHQLGARIFEILDTVPRGARKSPTRCGSSLCGARSSSAT